MKQSDRSRSIHATPLTLGGVVFAGFIIFGVALAWVAYQNPGQAPGAKVMVAIIVTALLAYVADGLSERLSLSGSELTFRAILRRPKTVDLCRYRELFIVHEGLNQERGIVSVVLKGGPDGERRLALGPFWHVHELEAFFTDATRTVGTCRLQASRR